MCVTLRELVYTPYSTLWVGSNLGIGKLAVKIPSRNFADYDRWLTKIQLSWDTLLKRTYLLQQIIVDWCAT
jgi:hypothetical protein